MIVKFFPNDSRVPVGKLADAELHFAGADEHRAWLSQYMDRASDPNQCGAAMTLLRALSCLDGLKLVGFAVWERKTGGRNVTFPARQYSVNGERRSYALLRPANTAAAQDRLRDFILDAFKAFEEQASAAEA